MHCQNLNLISLSNVPKGVIQKVNNATTQNTTEEICVHSEGNGLINAYSVYSGIDVFYNTFNCKDINFSKGKQNIIQFNYCHNGSMTINISNGNQIYLGPNDFSIHTLNMVEISAVTFPLGFYEGITISINLDEFDANPPEVIKDLNITSENLKNKFCSEIFTTITDNDNIKQLFSALYNIPQNMRNAYLKIKVQDLLIFLQLYNFSSKNTLAQHSSEQIEIINEIHDLLINNLDKHFTIDYLSKKFLINTTTLKEVFKSVYGLSIAAHIKEHRLEKAAFLLQNTDCSIADIAQMVGYESQSKFSTAFKNKYQVLPIKYRKQ